MKRATTILSLAASLIAARAPAVHAEERIFPDRFPQKGEVWAEPSPMPVSLTKIDGYPAFAELLEISGEATIAFWIDANGNVTRPFVQSSQPAGIFESTCLDFVRSFKYAPQRQTDDDAPRTRRWSYTCRFVLQ